MCILAYCAQNCLDFVVFSGIMMAGVGWRKQWQKMLSSSVITITTANNGSLKNDRNYIAVAPSRHNSSIA